MWPARLRNRLLNITCAHGTCAALLALILVAVPAGVRGQITPTFHAGVELVLMTATVVGPDGNWVSNLTADDFRLYEDGVEQPIAFFGTDDVPTDLAIMLDTSDSMSNLMRLSTAAAVDLVRALGPQDRAAVIAFGNQVEIRQPFTSDRSQLESAINKAPRRSGKTALYTSLYVALKQIASMEPAGSGMAVRRRAITLLSDGDDTASRLGSQEVIALARRLGVAIYTISIRSRIAPVTMKSRRDRAAYEMGALAHDTGARAFFPEEAGDLTGIYKIIAAELSHQYSIGYVPMRRAEQGRLARVVVVDRPDVRVRTGPGYAEGD